MINLYDETEKIKSAGYSEQNAQLKLGQDIILKAIFDSGLAKNATIKGGVVMRSISGNARRATQDLDLDLIRYSISDESIQEFVARLNCIEGISIKPVGRILELNHQDYKGKRVFVSITDMEGTEVSLKMDIGVHNDLSIEQDEYAFDVEFQDDSVTLLINSPAQMIAEKLKSMVRFGSRNTRYKDVFDICYLSDHVNIDQLKNCIKKYIFDDPTLKNVSDMNSIISRIERMFTNPDYRRELYRADKNWLKISTDEVLEKDLAFLKNINF